MDVPPEKPPAGPSADEPRHGPVTVLADARERTVAAAAGAVPPKAVILANRPTKRADGKEISRISGRWVNEKKGVDLTIRSLDKGRLQVTLADKGTGVGRFVRNMPGKFRFQIDGVGKGEFSVSNSDDSLIGWFVSAETGRKIHTRLQKVE
jgi:hypothetical protein